MSKFDQLYNVNDEQKSSFDKNGYLVLTDLLDSNETSLLQKWASEVKALPNNKGEHMHYEEVRGDGTVGHFRTENYANYHQGFNELFRGQRLGGVMETFFGEPAYLFKEKINYKEPGGSRGFNAHTDANAYNHAGAVKHLTYLIAVDDMTPMNGCLEIVAGSHKSEIPRKEDGRGISPAWEAEQTWTPLPLKAGGVVLFGSYIAHRSGPNYTPVSRKAIYATFNGTSEGDRHDYYYAHRREHFPPPSERDPNHDYSEGQFIYTGSKVTNKGQYLGGGPVDLKISELFKLLEAQGDQSYEKKTEGVTQLEHALQAAQLAREEGADDPTIVAALLHDVGHYIPHPDAVRLFEQGQDVGRRSHDAIGEIYLKQLGFPRTVTALVGGHVDAKRYLTATDPKYMDTLSIGSRRSLKHQGGPFTEAQVVEFEKDPLHKQKAQVRVWDDGAKRREYHAPRLETFRPIVQRVLSAGA